jgi:hypothetical protein
MKGLWDNRRKMERMNDIIWIKGLWDQRRKMEMMKDIRTMANVPQSVGDGF